MTGHFVEDGRCIVTDLPFEQCADCMGHGKVGEWNVSDVEFSMEAKYESTLACGHRSVKKQLILSTPEGWICESCCTGL